VLVAEMIADSEDNLLENCALKIQTKWRGKKAKLVYQQRLAERAAEKKQKDDAVTIFSKHWRARKARLELKRLKQLHETSIKRRVEVLIWSATKIQALFRGMKGRLRFDEKLREHKGKWKELFDEEKQRRFFYNKLTGEIRWRMPQDLLDLIPRPSCDNCSFYEAQLECAVCNELYCNQCWQQVHYGGRRKDHEFRSLYDFYGKRLDYGDGVFPCKWPSEVIQDEVQGWMLRVAPIRDPKHIYGSWEEYEDISGLKEGSQFLGHRSKKGVSSGESRVFYFNRETFEATYDVPPEVANVIQIDSNTENYPQNSLETYNYDSQQFYEQNYQGYYDSEGNWIEELNVYDGGWN
jgi:hypothetical protein